MFLDRTLASGLLISAIAVAVVTAIFLLGWRDISTVRQDSLLAAMVTSPRSVVFQDIGATVRLEVRGLYSDGAEGTLPDESGLPLLFRSSEPHVVSVDAAGLITTIRPGGADIIVEYGDIRARVPVIVYGPFKAVPPFDPQRVVAIAPGTEIVVNRVIVDPAGVTYDAGLVLAIATDYGAAVIAEWRNLGAALLEFDISVLDELETILQQLDGDPRVAAVALDFIYRPGHGHIETLKNNWNSAYDSTGLPGAWAQVERMGILASPVQIAVLDFDFSLEHDDALIQALMDAEFDASRITVRNGVSSLSISEEGSHGVAVASVIVAANNTPSTGTSGFSGAVGSVLNVPYHVHLLGIKSAADVKSHLDDIYEHERYIDVINMSFIQSAKYCTATDIRHLCKPFTYTKSAFRRLDTTMLVAAAGNKPNSPTGKAYAVSYVLPAGWAGDIDNLISVGALDENRADRACFSNYGSTSGDRITVAAQGEAVYAVNSGSSDGYGLWRGTSFAAPLVSSVVALMHAVDPSLTPTEIRTILRDSADSIVVDDPIVTDMNGNPCGRSDVSVGAKWKAVNADAAIAAVLDTSVKAEIVLDEHSGGHEGPGPVFFAVPITNTGRVTWKFQVYMEVTAPQLPGTGTIKRDALAPVDLLLAPGQTIPVRGRFWADRAGDWLLHVVVRRSDEARTCIKNRRASGCLDDATLTLTVNEAGRAPVPSTRAGLLRADANILVVADTTSSMEGRKISRVREAIIDFVDVIDDPGEYIGLLDFDTTTTVVIPLQAKAHSELLWEDAVRSLDADGDTAFYDAVARAVDLLASSAVEGRANIVIALTDGVDNSSVMSADSLIEHIQRSRTPVIVYLLGFGADADMLTLERIAEETGGAALPATDDNLGLIFGVLNTLF